jgi:hypothetical protein
MFQQLSWYKRICATPNRSNEVGREELAAAYLRYYVFKRKRQSKCILVSAHFLC